jgi:hypothetical protein
MHRILADHPKVKERHRLSHPTGRLVTVAWFKRWRNKMRNYTSDGDYPGSRGGGSGGEREMRNARAQADALAHRPDRFDGGGGFSS